MKKAISLFLALVMLVSVFAGLGITAYAADAQALWVDPVNGSDSAAGTQAAPFQTIEKAKAAAAALSAGGDVTVWLHGGTYRVSNAITFTSADSGKNGHVITFAHFFKVGFPTMLATVAVSAIYLIVRFPPM